MREHCAKGANRRLAEAPGGSYFDIDRRHIAEKTNWHPPPCPPYTVPMAGSDDRSLERLRETTIDRLTSSYSHDLLAETEYMERLEAANTALTHGELRNLIVDLPALPAVKPSSPPESPLHQADLPSVTDSAPEQSTFVAVFSGVDKKGVWTAPKTMNVIAVFGGGDIDLRDAVLPREGLTIRAVAALGGVDIIVSEDMNVEVSGAGILGAFEGNANRSTPHPDAPTIRVTGVAVLGGVEVKVK